MNYFSNLDIFFIFNNFIIKIIQIILQTIGSVNRTVSRLCLYYPAAASQSPPSAKSSPVPSSSTSVYGLAAVKSDPGTAASPSNMTSTKAQDE